MTGKSLREQALEETARFFWKERGYVPDQDSDEWEAEYRRHFELAKHRQATGAAATPEPDDAIEAEDASLPVLTGTPAEKRWAATLRAQRLQQIAKPELRNFLASAWVASKQWIATADLALPQLLRRAEAEYGEHRRRVQGEDSDRNRARLDHAQQVADRRSALAAAEISAESLVELIDCSQRFAVLPLKEKLAELIVEGRRLRIFETAEKTRLMVLEKTASARTEYAIERDPGLFADLLLFGEGDPS